MKAIETFAAYTVETDHLADLRRAEAAALQDEAQALATLAQERPRESALSAVGRLLAGEPRAGVDDAAQNARLADARQRLTLLRAAIEEQETIVAVTRGTLSAKVCSDATPGHLQAAGGIIAALEGLRTALAAETSIREGIAIAGFACGLEPLASPELAVDDSESALNRLLRDVRRYVAVAALRDGKGGNVRLLVDAAGVGVAGDVLKVDGPAAAALVAGGRGEVTTSAPRRTARQSAHVEEVFS